MAHDDHIPFLAIPGGIATLGNDGIVPSAQLPPRNPDTPGLFVLGGALMHYPFVGVVEPNEVQYTRVWLTAGLTIDRMQFFLSNTTGQEKKVRMGIYAQNDPSSTAADPAMKVAETASTSPAQNVFTSSLLLPAYTVPVTGYYWLAFARTAGTGLFDVVQSGLFRDSFLPVRRQATMADTLPANASGLSNPASAVVYLAAMREGS